LLSQNNFFGSFPPSILILKRLVCLFLFQRTISQVIFHLTYLV
jgi:hypothetical protein